jgi:hypothetical protein
MRNMLYNKLVQIKYELSKYHRDRQYLERYYVNKRLTESLNSYYKDLEDSLRYLDNRKEENVFKQLGG